MSNLEFEVLQHRSDALEVATESLLRTYDLLDASLESGGASHQMYQSIEQSIAFNSKVFNLPAISVVSNEDIRNRSKTQISMEGILSTVGSAIKAIYEFMKSMVARFFDWVSAAFNRFRRLRSGFENLNERLNKIIDSGKVPIDAELKFKLSPDDSGWFDFREVSNIARNWSEWVSCITRELESEKNGALPVAKAWVEQLMSVAIDVNKKNVKGQISVPVNMSKFNLSVAQPYESATPVLHDLKVGVRKVVTWPGGRGILVRICDESPDVIEKLRREDPVKYLQALSIFRVQFEHTRRYTNGMVYRESCRSLQMHFSRVLKSIDKVIGVENAVNHHMKELQRAINRAEPFLAFTERAGLESGQGKQSLSAFAALRALVYSSTSYQIEVLGYTATMLRVYKLLAENAINGFENMKKEKA